jgi:hypothetical protein
MIRSDGLEGDLLEQARTQARVVFADGTEIPFIDLFSFVQVAAQVASHMSSHSDTMWVLLHKAAVERMPGVIEALTATVERVMKTPDEDAGVVFFPMTGDDDAKRKAGYAAVDAVITQRKEIAH